MPKKKGPKMAHPQPAQEALIREMESLIEQGTENLDENEIDQREQKASEIVENARARASRQERA
jgi:hypothetical protein